MHRMDSVLRRAFPLLLALLLAVLMSGLMAPAAHAQSPAGPAVTAAVQAATPATPQEAGGEANLKIPDLSVVNFLGMPGHTLLMYGLLICALGFVFGITIFRQLQRLPVHESMREMSELIYETCKTYLITQGKFLLILEIFIGSVILLYFGVLQHLEPVRVAIILAFSVLGIAGSYGVAWFGIRVNTFANSRTAFASLKGKPYPCYSIPLRAGMSIGMLLISVELTMMLFILLFVPGDYAGPCFIGFAIGESLGAAALRIAGGIFTKIADIGSDLMKIVFNIKEDDARNPGVIADCTGDNAGDSVGPSADGFETYGVTGVALITFILLAVKDPTVKVQLLVWIFVMRIVMILASGISYLVNEAFAKAKYEHADDMNYEHPLTSLVWLTSIISVALTFLVSYLVIPTLSGNPTFWWKLSAVITCGTLAGAIIPEFVKVFTSTSSKHVAEVVESSKQGGASLNILSGLVAGNFSAFWMGITMVVLMGAGYEVSRHGFEMLMLAPAVFAFGLVAFGFLGMGPVTIAVDSYGPVTDNAQSVFELSTIEQIPNIAASLKSDYGFDVNFERAKHLLEENDGAGNTFKATAKPVLIGTAVVGSHDDDLLDHRGAHQRPHAEPRQALDAPSAVPARAHHGRRDHLLVHRRQHAGGDHRRLPGRGVHQGQHQARGRHQGIGGGLQEGGGDLHPVRAEGDVEHLPRRLLRHARLRVPGAVLLHRLPDLDRRVRVVSGDLHGQRRRGLGQRQEDRRGHAQAEGNGAPQRDRGRRYRGRSVQGYLVGGPQPDHQVHHPVRAAGRRTRRVDDGDPGLHGHNAPGRGVLRRVAGVHLAFLLPHAHRGRGGVIDAASPRSGRPYLA